MKQRQCQPLGIFGIRPVLFLGWMALAIGLPGAPAHAERLRVATFNASMNRNAAGELVRGLSTGGDKQVRAVAEIIQRVRPDVLLINEFDYDASARDGGSEAARLFQQNYLSVSRNGAEPLRFPYVYAPPTNTGLPSGFDLNNDGNRGGPVGTSKSAEDAFGFGRFPGQYGMLLLSTYPIVTEEIRTFQTLLWKQMPGALLPDDANTAAPGDWYSPEELSAIRLSSKNHCDFPIDIHGTRLHLLVAHPTPPVFDGSEDRNGRRNHDEIRLFADYIDPERSSYIRDDRGLTGGLGIDQRFVILGDYNADPFDGDSVDGAAQQLLEHPLVNASLPPASEGGRTARSSRRGKGANHRGDPAFDTAEFSSGSGPGNLRVDYVLPSRFGLELLDGGVYWPTSEDPQSRLAGVASDHRLVFIDIAVPHAAD